MNRQQKELVINQLSKQFQESQAAFVVQYKGLTVAQLQKLRKDLYQKGSNLHVAKARLMKRAVDPVEDAQQLVPYFKEQVGLVFARQEPPAIAKLLHNFSKENNALKLVAGIFDSKMYDASSLARIATLPPREVLLAQLCGLLKHPMTSLAVVLKEIEKQKQQIV
jgi:large subunit ribosomal protein L10